jgi:hypothetical protein
MACAAEGASSTRHDRPGKQADDQLGGGTRDSSSSWLNPDQRPFPWLIAQEGLQPCLKEEGRGDEVTTSESQEYIDINILLLESRGRTR